MHPSQTYSSIPNHTHTPQLPLPHPCHILWGGGGLAEWPRGALTSAGCRQQFAPPFPILGASPGWLGRPQGGGPAGDPAEAKRPRMLLYASAIKVAGAALPAQGSNCGGGQEGRHSSRARAPRGPAGAAAGPGGAPAPSPQPGRSSGARRCCILPAAAGTGRDRPPADPGHRGAPRSGTAFRGPAAQTPPRDAARGGAPRPAARTRGAPRTPRRPGSERSGNETEPTGTFSKPGAVRSDADSTQVGVPGKTDGPGGSAPPRPPPRGAAPLAPREGPGAGSAPRPAPGLGSAHSERKTSQHERSGDPCPAGVPPRELL